MRGFQSGQRRLPAMGGFAFPLWAMSRIVQLNFSIPMKDLINIFIFSAILPSTATVNAQDRQPVSNVGFDHTSSEWDVSIAA